MLFNSPQDSFTVVNDTIVFVSALTSSDSIDFIMALGEVYDIGKPTDGTVVGASATTQTSLGGFFQGNNFDRGADFSGKDDIFRTHSATLSTDVTIASTDNSYAAGIPLTIANGVTLTVSGNLSIGVGDREWHRH